MHYYSTILILGEKRVKWGVTENMKFDNKEHGKYSNEKNETNETRAESYREAIGVGQVL